MLLRKNQTSDKHKQFCKYPTIIIIIIIILFLRVVLNYLLFKLRFHTQDVEIWQ